MVDMQRRSSRHWGHACVKAIPRGKIVPDHAEIDQTAPTTASQTIQGRWESLSILFHTFEDFELRTAVGIERVSDRGFNNAFIFDEPADVSCTSAGRVAPSKRPIFLVRDLSEYLSVPFFWSPNRTAESIGVNGKILERIPSEIVHLYVDNFISTYVHSAAKPWSDW